jgi:prophage antirepressor-like protein
MDIIIDELKYNNTKIIVLKDSFNIIWFNAYHVCKILGYNDPKNIVKKIVNKNHMDYLKNIFSNYRLYPGAQPKSIYLNESGLYTLLIRSKKPNAEKFFMWVVEDVLPSIRKTGIYTANKAQIKEIKKLNQIIDQKDQKLKDKDLELKEEKLKNLSLENNQKNKHICTKGKYIYILKAKLDDYIDKDKPDILKIGKTRKYKIRMSTYNTSVKDNVIVLYRAKVDDISAVENCLKSRLSKKVYRSYKEYYEVTLSEAIETIKICIKFSGTTLISEDKFYLDYKMSRSTQLNGFEINFSSCNDQKGGYDDYEYHTYDIHKKMYVFYNYILNVAKNNKQHKNPINNLFNIIFIKNNETLW